ncbi:MAG: Type 1 glutamine amidotransferase-like domain-containing protein [Marmoricola sp.]|nr:Type 1 glutamine amidotransferase-like domain-containing protein [Marmoricola sp.]
MSEVFLIGGGWDADRVPEVYGGFVDAARRRAGGSPTVLVVLMGDDEESAEYHQRFVDTLESLGDLTVTARRLPYDGTFDAGDLDGVDALFVGGGPTPDYHAALAPAYPRIRELVAAGLPYAGFSAGAEIAATTALVGGWQVDGVPVAPEDAGEDLDELTVVEGLGLVDGAIEVHTAQWGTLSRLVAAVQAGLVPHGLALDESTTLEVATGAVTGAGRVWSVRRGTEPGAGVLVSRG